MFTNYVFDTMTSGVEFNKLHNRGLFVAVETKDNNPYLDGFNFDAIHLNLEKNMIREAFRFIHSMQFFHRQMIFIIIDTH